MPRPYEARNTFFCENPGGCRFMIYQGRDFYWFNDLKLCPNCWKRLVLFVKAGKLKVDEDTG